MSTTPSQREVLGGIAFFGAMSIIIPLFLRPLDMTEWISLFISIGFVVAGCFVLWRRSRSEHFRAGRLKNKLQPAAASVSRVDLVDLDAVTGAPSPEEHDAIETLLHALEAVEALAPNEVEPGLLWRAAKHDDPDLPVGTSEALNALATLNQAGRFAAKRMTFVPVDVEYDEHLLASITVSILNALGHRIEVEQIRFSSRKEEATVGVLMTIPLWDGDHVIRFPALWKNAPPEIFPVLAGMRLPEDPRDLICADPGTQILIFLAVTPGGGTVLNRRLRGEHDLFGPA